MNAVEAAAGALRQRPRRWAGKPAAVGKGLLCAGLLLSAVRDLVVVWPRPPNFLDYEGFVAAGRALASGINPYGPYPRLPGITDQGFSIPWPQASPPPALFIFRLFSLFDVQTGARAWFVLSCLSYGLAILLLQRIARVPFTPLLVAWLVAIHPLYTALQEGQLYIALACLAAGAWLCLQRRHVVAGGVLMGMLVAIKPNFAVWPLALMLAGDAVPGLLALAGAAFAAGVSGIAYGPAILSDWLLNSAAGFTDSVSSNGSVFALGNLIGRPASDRAIGLALAPLLCGALLLWAQIRKPETERLSGMAILVALLAAPITFAGYLVIALPVVVAHRWRPATYAAALALLLPLTAFLPLLVLGASEVIHCRSENRGQAGPALVACPAQT